MRTIETIEKMLIEHKIDLVCYGYNDLTIHLYIESIIKNEQEFVSIINSISAKVENRNDVLCYLLIRFLDQMKMMVPRIKSEYKAAYLNVIQNAHEKVNEFGTEEVPPFIEENCAELLDDRILVKGLLRILDENADNLNKTTIETILEKKLNHIAGRFKLYQKRIISDTELLSKFASSKSFNKTKDYPQEYLRSLIAAYDATNNGKTVYNDVFDAIEKECDALAESIVSGESIDFNLFELYCKVLKKTDRCKTKYIGILKERSKFETEYLKKHGKISKFEVDIGKPVNEQLEKQDLWTFRINLTHYSDNGVIKSCFDIGDAEQNSFTEAFFSGKKSEYYTGTRQMHIEAEIGGKSAINLYLANRFSREDLLKADYVLISRLYSHISDQELCSEILQMYDEDYETLRTDCSFSRIYGSCMYTIAMTEKLLRVFLKSNGYSDKGSSEKLDNLSRILNNPFIIGTLGNDVVRGIQFHLSTMDEIGKDWRNRLAHWDYISRAEINKMVLASLLHIFNCSLNSIIIYCETKKKETNIEKSEK